MRRDTKPLRPTRDHRTTILIPNAGLSLSDIPMILAFGLLSDYIGRRRIFLAGMAMLAIFAVPYFMLVSTNNIWLFLLGGLVVSGMPQRGVRTAVGLLRRTVRHQDAPTAAARLPISSLQSLGAWRR